ncbi:hypothetical protein I4F81_009489 [Pyropia yezoensis]|uniref:Uncharacterized protein n=1 Tax=Pyropia yezoensis TaxID=2788 RepID=A0ACC3C9W1_PYRYE|nr:hypothetical protein I4F81_009489 [Neopyropia yezoensis]
MGRKAGKANTGSDAAMGGLGRSLVKKAKANAVAARRTEADVGRHAEAAGAGGALKSVLEASDLSELMETAALTNTSFVADRYAPREVAQSVVITPGAGGVAEGEAAVGGGRRVDDRDTRALEVGALHVPRRPPWKASMDKSVLDRSERTAFLAWRRALADVEEQLAGEAPLVAPAVRRGPRDAADGAVFARTTLTPFEKNLQVWRQLWRVVERSDVVVQIVDARDPELYYCRDLDRYVVEESGKRSLVLLNKADLLSEGMRRRWAAHFRSKGLRAVFFSAKPNGHQEGKEEGDGFSSDEESDVGSDTTSSSSETESEEEAAPAEGEIRAGESLVASEKEASAASRGEATMEEGSAAVTAGDADGAPVTSGADTEAEPPTVPDAGGTAAASKAPHIVVGMVGYPNVGKSSTTNVLLAHTDKRVAVSATPGKTKHFQTMPMSPTLTLCDCPGLVFPNFSASKADLVVAGVLPIDQLRGSATAPISLIAARVPAALLSAMYGIRLPAVTEVPVRGEDGEPTGAVVAYTSAPELLSAHATARGMMSDHGRPDVQRSARLILKDFVNGRLRYAHPPPPTDGDGALVGLGGVVIEAEGEASLDDAAAAKFAARAARQDETAAAAEAAAARSMIRDREATEAAAVAAAERSKAHVRGTGGRRKRGKAGAKAVPRAGPLPGMVAAAATASSAAPAAHYTRVSRPYLPAPKKEFGL